MSKIIPLDSEYEFVFLEEKDLTEHPLSDYYLKLDDLSINLYISIKWCKWGYFFLTSIISELDNLKEEYRLDYIISKGIQNIKEMEENKKVLFIDNLEIKEDFDDILKREYFNGKLGEIFHENAKIHMKLKMNLREFLIISNMLYPSLIKWEETIYLNKI